jgi:hypothetical protein
MEVKGSTDVPDTKRFVKPEATGSASPAPTELQTRIPCTGRSAADVIAELNQALLDAERKNLEPLIVLQDLGKLADSVTTLIKAISRLLVGYPRTVTFWEESGYTEAFLSAMEQPGEPKKAQFRPSDPG